MPFGKAGISATSSTLPSGVVRPPRPGRGAVGAPAGPRHARQGAVVPERDALAADLREGDAPGAEPDRPLGELESGRQDGPLHGGVSLAGTRGGVNLLTARAWGALPGRM